MNNTKTTPRVFIEPDTDGTYLAKIIEPEYTRHQFGSSPEEAIQNLLEEAYMEKQWSILEAIEEDGRYVCFSQGTIVDFDFFAVSPFQGSRAR